MLGTVKVVRLILFAASFRNAQDAGARGGHRLSGEVLANLMVLER